MTIKAPSPYDRLTRKNQLLLLTYSLANHHKQIILFVPTKAGCVSIVKELLTCCDSLNTDHTGILGISDEHEQSKRDRVCDVIIVP